LALVVVAVAAAADDDDDGEEVAVGDMVTMHARSKQRISARRLCRRCLLIQELRRGVGPRRDCVVVLVVGRRSKGWLRRGCALLLDEDDDSSIRPPSLSVTDALEAAVVLSVLAMMLFQGCIKDEQEVKRYLEDTFLLLLPDVYRPQQCLM
jgi:hypothetical protein